MSSNLQINIAIPKFSAAHCCSQLDLLALATVLFSSLFIVQIQPASADGGLSPFGQQVTPPGMVSYTMVPGISTGSLSDMQSDYDRGSGTANTEDQGVNTPDAQLALKENKLLLVIILNQPQFLAHPSQHPSTHVHW